MDAFDELVAGYLEGHLDEAESERLAEMVRRDDALRRRFLELAGVDGLLRAQLAPGRLDDALERRIDMCLVGRDQEERTAEAVLRRIENRPEARRRKGTHSTLRAVTATSRTRRPADLWPALAVAAAFVAFLLGVYLVLESGRVPSSTQARRERTAPGPGRAAVPESPSVVRSEKPSDLRDRAPARSEDDPFAAERPATRTSVPPDATAPEAAMTPAPVPAVDADGVPVARRADDARPDAPVGRTPAATSAAPRQGGGPSPDTAAIVARLEHVEGDVHLIGPAGKSPLRPGDRLRAGQGLVTGAYGSAAVMKYDDGTSLTLGPDTEIRDLYEREAARGKRLGMARGMLVADVASQPPDQPMVVTAPHGEARILGTSFRLVVDPEPGGAMRLEVRSGKVRLTRERDGRSVDVAAGQFAEVIPGAEFIWPRRVLTVSFQDGAAPTPQYEGTRDTYIAEYKSGAAKNFGTSQILVADGDSADSGQPLMDRSALIRWDLSAIPRGSMVVWAEIGIQVVNESGGRPFGIYELKREWVESQATWMGPSAGISWQKPGALGDLDREGSALGALGPSKNGAYSVPLNRSGLAAIQSWVNNPAANHGLIVADTENGDALIFKSRKAAPHAERPHITVSFVTR